MWNLQIDLHSWRLTYIEPENDEVWFRWFSFTIWVICCFLFAVHAIWMYTSFISPPQGSSPGSWGSQSGRDGCDGDLHPGDSLVAGQVGSWIMTLQKLEGVYGKQKIYEKQKMIFRKFENNISPTWGKWNGIKWWLSDSSFHWISWKDIIPNLLRFLRDDIDSALPKLEFAKAPNSKLNEPSLPSRI